MLLNILSTCIPSGWGWISIELGSSKLYRLLFRPVFPENFRDAREAVAARNDMTKVGNFTAIIMVHTTKGPMIILGYKGPELFYDKEDFF